LESAPKSEVGKRGPRPFEQRVRTIAAALSIPSLGLGATLIWIAPVAPVLKICLTMVLLLIVAGTIALLHDAVTQPLRGLANVVESYRAGDYTVRGRRAASGDALGDLVNEINSLGTTLHEQRLRALEATALLDKLVSGIDVAVLAFDTGHRLRLLNPAGSRLLGFEPARILGRRAEELALEEFLGEEATARIVNSIAGRSGRWQVTHGTFREGGLAQHLLIIADVRQALREEERAAWQRLIRVIGHEVNNSLTPIRSLAQTLESLLREGLPGNAPRNDALDALAVISGRTEALGRFLAQYSRLARLPAPRPRWVSIAPLLTRVTALDTEHPIAVSSEPGLEACVDEDQLEQALINLIKNAVEAQEGQSGGVAINAQCRGDALVIAIKDGGPGIASTDNLFVPFFTTKPGGSGVGLALSRQIAEAHGGTLALENRSDARGAVATLDIPGAARVLSGGT
jgi:two-component system nitrogen regulation sensor histidine kinase NtrY